MATLARSVSDEQQADPGDIRRLAAMARGRLLASVHNKRRKEERLIRELDQIRRELAELATQIEAA